LIGIIEPIRDSFQEKTKVDEALRNLDKKICNFLKEYDVNSDGQVDIAELENARKKLTNDLRER